MSGALFVCGTPIGNLEDISLRVLRTLKEVDLIAAEDTRHSAKLLNFYNIKTHLTSYHEHNKNEKGIKLINQLIDGKNIALISDAGMPGISDPGEDLIKLCYENNISVTTVPGPTAVITAIVLSGFSTRRYIFEGFLPKEKKERKFIFESLEKEPRTIVFYESPHHLLKTLKEFFEYFGNRKISVIRELTKQFEEVKTDYLENIISQYENINPKGEFVLVLEGKPLEEILKEEIQKWEEISIEKHVKIYLEQNFSEKDAMKKVAKERGIAKRDVYNFLVSLKEK